MPVFQRSIVDNAGNVLPSASVEVRDQVTSTLVQLYSDYALSATIGNPITADPVTGFVRFYVAPGRYRIVATLGLLSRTWEDEVLGLDEDLVEHLREQLDIRSFGAVGDGVTNDYAAWVAAAAVGGAILVPENFNSAIASASLSTAGIAVISNTAIRGVSKETSKITVTGVTACNLFRFTNRKNNSISNLTLRQNGVATTTANGELVYWEQLDTATVVGGSFSMRNVRLENCQADNWVGIYNDSLSHHASGFLLDHVHVESETGNARAPTTSGISSCALLFGDAAGASTKLIADIEITGCTFNGAHIKQAVGFYHNTARAHVHHNIVSAIHSAAAFTTPDVQLYAMFAYKGAPGTAIAPDQIKFDNNIINGCVDCGLYAQGCNRLEWNHNQVINQTGTADGTLVKGAGAFNLCTNASAHGNKYDSCARGTQVLLPAAGIFKLSQEEITNPVASAISFRATSVTGATTGKLYIDGLTIEAGGASTIGMDFDFGATFGLSLLSVRNIDIEAANECVRFRRTDATTPAMGVVLFDGFRLNGASVFGLTFKSYANTSQRASFRNGTIGNITSTGYGLELDSSLGVDVFDVLFHDIGTSAFGLSTAATQGTLNGVRYQNTATGDRIVSSGSVDLGLDTPTHSGNIGDFVQNVNTGDDDADEMILVGWRNFGTTNWHPQYMSTVTPAS